MHCRPRGRTYVTKHTLPMPRLAYITIGWQMPLAGYGRAGALLAVLLLKPDGSDRPIGVGCAFRRCAGKLIGAQDRVMINSFYTQQLPEEAMARDQCVTAATAALAEARLAYEVVLDEAHRVAVTVALEGLAHAEAPSQLPGQLCV